MRSENFETADAVVAHRPANATAKMLLLHPNEKELPSIYCTVSCTRTVPETTESKILSV